MAAFGYDDYRASDEDGTFAAVLNWGGAILSLVLIAGLATWGWKLWVRDVSGVPVVRALEGPMRIAPDEPGGLASDYQGLTVNRIAESRVEERPSEQVVLAPAPATLDEDEDLAMAELPAVAPEPENDAPLIAVAPVPQLGTGERIEIDEAPVIVDGTASILPGDTIEADATPADQPGLATPSATDLAVAAALSGADIAPEPSVATLNAAPNVPVSTPRPVMRPTNLQPVSFAAPTLQSGEVDPKTIAAGTRLVQLGAYGSPEVARAEWQTAEARFGDYMADKARVIQRVESGGREFFRLRVHGFDDLSDARRFCAVLVTDGSNCIPVIHD
jgi:hypothetical protein